MKLAGSSLLLLTASAVTAQSHSAALTCQPSTFSAVTGYNFYRSLTSGGPYTILPSCTNLPTCSCTDSTVISGTQYFYVSAAVSSTGVSSYSNQAPALIPGPLPPTNLNTTETSSNPPQFKFSWTLSASTGVTREYIYRDGVRQKTLAATATSYLENTAKAGKTYKYQIVAMLGKIPSSFSNTVTVTPVN